jgi:DNA-directed RNA polymerase subunit RPC12/RpoP
VDGVPQKTSKIVSLPNSFFRNLFKMKEKMIRKTDSIIQSEYFCSGCLKNIKIINGKEVFCKKCNTKEMILEEGKLCLKCGVGTIIENNMVK